MTRKLLASLAFAALLPAAAAWSADDAKGAVVNAPPEGKGQVVFFRPMKLGGAAVSYKVREGETELGLLSNGHYFIVPTEPGPHAYVVHSEVKDILNLEVEPGETYYVRGSVEIGIVAGRPNITPVQKADFDKVAAKLKPPKVKADKPD